MKNIGIVFFLFCFNLLNAQQKIDLSNHQGVVISYKLTKLDSSDDKKDKYQATVSAENQNDYDLFYTVQPSNPYRFVEGDNFEKCFVKIDVTNSRLFSGGITNLQGQLTRLLLLDKGWMLYLIPKKETVSQNFTFTVSKGVTPVVTEKFIKRLNKLSAFF